MTDKEVQKLNRRELLSFLLDAQTENEALRRERAELRKQLRQLEEDLAKAREASSGAELKAALLSEPEEMPAPPQKVADSDALSRQQEELEVQKQRLLEWEQRLRQREDLLLSQEAGIKKLVAATDGEASRVLQEARQHASDVRNAAETEAVSVLRQVEEQAEETARQAREAAALLLQNAEAAAAASEQKAAQEAELILQRAQDDSNAFWQDVTAALQKRLFSDGGNGDGE